MGDFVNQIRAKLGLEPKRDKTVVGGVPNEVIINRRLSESDSTNPVVFAPARMNPPTPAHRLIVDTVKKAAQEYNAPHHIVLTRTHDIVKKKRGAAVRNPLTPEQKIKHARRFFPDANVQLADKKSPNLLSQLSDLHGRGHDHLVMVAGSDRIPEYQRLIDTYNGKSGPHGHFNFKKVDYRSAGERDPEAEGQAGWSATKSRQTAEAGNFEHFKKNAVPSHVSDAHARELHDELRGGMGLNEDVGFNMAGAPIAAIPTRAARDIRGKKSSLTNTPPPGDKGNIGYDANLDKGTEKDNIELSRRRAKKRLFQVGYLEGYDTSSDMDVRPSANPVVNVTVPTAKPKLKSFKQMKEGQFTDVPGEQGSPNYGSDVDNSSSDSVTLRTEKKSKKLKEEAEYIQERGEDAKGLKRPTELGAGLTRKGAKAAGVKTAVTTPPSKLDPKGKAAKRRKSFCARMGGMPGPMKDEKGRPTRKAMSLRRWNCEETEIGATNQSDRFKSRFKKIRALKEHDIKDIRGDGDEDKDFRGDLLKRGTRVQVLRQGYEGLGNIDHYDVSSKAYVVSMDKDGTNLFLKHDELRPIAQDTNESKNTPYVKPHYGDSSNPQRQTGWKSSNKHGKVKYWQMFAKKSAEKHAHGGQSLVEQVMSIMESTNKVCPACTDQTDGRPTPHTVKDGHWTCGLCGHKTPKKTYSTKKSRDMEDLIRSLNK